MLLNILKAAGDFTCGNSGISFDPKIPGITSKIVLIIEIVVPILLVIFGMLDLGKAIIAQKEDEIKKGQQTFVKRLITAALVFFVVFIVKLVIGLVSDDSSNLTNCLNCFLTADEKEGACRDAASTVKTEGKVDNLKAK